MDPVWDLFEVTVHGPVEKDNTLLLLSCSVAVVLSDLSRNATEGQKRWRRRQKRVILRSFLSKGKRLKLNRSMIEVSNAIVHIHCYHTLYTVHIL